MGFEDIISKLPTPYYRDPTADIVIYCADCRQVLPLIPDKSIDLVLTDPPYNVGLDYSDGDNKPNYMNWCESWWKLMPRPLFFTPGMVNLSMWYWIATPSWVMSWVKPNQCSPSGLGGFNTWEPILVYGKSKKAKRNEEIRQKYYAGASVRELARQYKVHALTIRGALSGR